MTNCSSRQHTSKSHTLTSNRTVFGFESQLCQRCFCDSRALIEATSFDVTERRFLRNPRRQPPHPRSPSRIAAVSPAPMRDASDRGDFHSQLSFRPRKGFRAHSTTTYVAPVASGRRIKNPHDESETSRFPFPIGLCQHTFRDSRAWIEVPSLDAIARGCFRNLGKSAICGVSPLMSSPSSQKIASKTHTLTMNQPVFRYEIELCQPPFRKSRAHIEGPAFDVSCRGRSIRWIHRRHPQAFSIYGEFLAAAGRIQKPHDDSQNGISQREISVVSALFSRFASRNRRRCVDVS